MTDIIENFLTYEGDNNDHYSDVYYGLQDQ